MMAKKIVLNFTDEERTKYERFKRKKDAIFNPYLAGKSPSHSSIKRESSEVSKNKEISSITLANHLVKDEPAIIPAFNMLLEGMGRGNKCDQLAAEALIKSMRYKNVSDKFYKNCEKEYSVALLKFDAAVKGLDVVISPSTSISINNGTVEVKHDNRVTQRIFFPDKK
jgi:hypothetical protein